MAALFLGLHNLYKKYALRGNEAFPVLLGSITYGFILLLLVYICSIYFPEFTKGTGFYIASIPWETHGFIFIKSMIMATYWVLAYQALKHLPITIVAPKRSAWPFFTFIGAILIYKEQPNFL